MMSSPIEDLADEEYLDDPIQLIPESDVITTCPQPKEFSAYKQQSYVPVTFFNIDRNIKLLSNCRPLCIKLVDCYQYPWYYTKLNKQYCDNKVQNYEDISDSSVDDDLIYNEDIEKVSESLSIEAKSLLNRVVPNGLTVKLKNNKTKTKKKEKDVDFKKNKGLIGMKIAPTFEVIEIDDDSDESRSGNSNNDNKSPGDVITELNEKTGDVISELNKKAGDIISQSNEMSSDVTSELKKMPSDVISKIIEKPDDDTSEFDIWNIQNSNDVDVEVGLTIKTSSDNEKIKTAKDSNDITNNNLSLDLINMKKNNKVIVDKTEYSNGHNQEATYERAVMSNINNIIYSKEKTMALKETDDATRKEDNEENLGDKSIEGKELSHETAIESTEKSKELINNEDGKRISSVAKKVIESESVIKAVGCSLSPVFPCTSPKKIKKYNYNKPDKSKLEISQPKDFTNNKFNPNRLSSPKSIIKAPAENIQENNTKNMTSVYSKAEVLTQNKEQIIRLNLKETEKIYTGVIVNRKKVENNFRPYLPSQLPFFSGQKIIQDIKNTNTVDSKLETQIINKEQVIKLSLDEHIHKNIGKQKDVTDNIRSEIQRLNGDNTTLKVPFQANKIHQLPSHPRATEERPHVSHSIDTILHQSNLDSTSIAEGKRVKVFKTIVPTVLQHESNSMSSGLVDKRPQILLNNRIRPSTGSIPNLQNMVYEMARPNNVSQSRDPVHKRLNLDPAPAPTKKITSQHTTLENSTTDANTRNQITHLGHKESSLRNDSTNLASSGTVRTTTDYSQKSIYGNHTPNGVVQNVHHLYEQKRTNLSEHVIPGYLRQECYIAPNGPQHRPVIRPMMKPDGTPILSVRNYTRHMYANMTNNSLPFNPYPGRYNGDHSSYWPFQYARMPPPPLQNSSRTSPNILRSYRKGNQQIIVARPAPENLLNNNFTHKSNLIDINLNYANPVKASDSIGVNKSPRVVSSKTEMFEELEKEMMNIHHENLEHIINKDCGQEKYSNLEKCDPRKKPNLNATNNTELLNNTAPGQSTNKINKKDTKLHNDRHDKTKNSKHTAKILPVKRPSVELVSKDSAKKKKNVISKAEKICKSVNETENSRPGYSPPILPIPSFKQTLDILTRANNDAQKRLEASEKSRKKLSMNENSTKEKNSNLKKDKVKKISLDEYKKRGDKSVCERKKREHERKKEGDKVRKIIEAKNSDQDQGYDSDSTIVLN